MTFSFQLKRLRMRVELNFPTPGSICLEHGEGPGSVPHDYVAATEVEPNIIGVVSELDGREGFKAGCVEHLYSPIARGRARERNRRLEDERGPSLSRSGLHRGEQESEYRDQSVHRATHSCVMII